MNEAIGKPVPRVARRNRSAAGVLALLLLAGPIACAQAAADTPAKAPASAAASTAPDTGAADLAADATYVLPGRFTRGLVLEDLRKRYGAANVTLGDIDGAEGEISHGIILFAADPQRRAEIFLDDEAKPHGISAIRVTGAHSRWHLDNGVHVGMTLAALVAANGKPVTFSGTGWDYGGGILDWHAGRLAPSPGAPVFRSLVLTQQDDAPPDSVPVGDAEFRSDDPHYPNQGKLLVVGQIMVVFVDRGQSAL